MPLKGARWPFSRFVTSLSLARAGIEAKTKETMHKIEIMLLIIFDKIGS